MKNYILLCVLIIFSVCLKAQDKKERSSSSVSTIFSTVPEIHIANGDTSFQNALSISTLLDLRNKKGWGISYSPSFTLNHGIYMHTLSGGYERYGSGNFDIAFSYAHLFFAKNSTIPFSPLTNEIDAYINYNGIVLGPVLASSAGFGHYVVSGVNSQAVDFVAAIGVNHHFDWEHKALFTSLEFTPSLLVNAGTDGYFSFLNHSKYLSHSRQFIHYVKNGKGKQGSNRGGGNNQQVSSFMFNNIELNMEGELNKGAFTLRPNGSIFLPAQKRYPVYGYWQLTVQYHF